MDLIYQLIGVNLYSQRHKTVIRSRLQFSHWWQSATYTLTWQVNKIVRRLDTHTHREALFFLLLIVSCVPLRISVLYKLSEENEDAVIHKVKGQRYGWIYNAVLT